MKTGIRGHILAILCFLILFGCGGGGGGGIGVGVVNPYTDLSQPLSSSVGLATQSSNFTVSSPYATSPLNFSGNTVALTVDPYGIKITVNDVNGLPYSETFAAADLVGRVDFYTFDGTATTPITQLAAYSKTDIYSTRSLLYFVPSASLFRYSTLGYWEHVRSDGLVNAGFVSAGIPTVGADIPTTGTATYTGFSLGILNDGTQNYYVGATASASADFGARTIAFTTADSAKAPVSNPSAAVSDPTLNLSGTLIYSAGANGFSGSLSTGDTGANGVLTGTASGQFYGPAAVEMGGAYQLQGGSAKMAGGFALKQ